MSAGRHKVYRRMVRWSALVAVFLTLAAVTPALGRNGSGRPPADSPRAEAASDRSQAASNKSRNKAPSDDSQSTDQPQASSDEPQAASEPAGVLWSADYETGNTSQWDTIAISGDARSSVVTSPVHSGRYSNALTIYGADGSGSSPGVRMVFKNSDNVPQEGVRKNLPDEAYYSAWYYIPDDYTVSWLNIHQWKQQDGGSGRKLYSATLYNDRSGNLVFKLATKVGSNGQWGTHRIIGDTSGPVPIGRWFHLESYYKWDENNGRIVTWLDGEKIWDVSGIKTAFDWDFSSRSRQWAVNNYADDTTPESFTIYVDDAAVSTTRLGQGDGGGGTGWGGRCAGLTPTIVGTPGNDVIVGTPGRDIIHGLAGRDVIRGKGGNDVICGGRGRDRIFGGSGDDLVRGGPNFDIVKGGSGRDRVRGGSDFDDLYGGRAHDVCHAGRDRDDVHGCEVRRVPS